MDIDHRGFFRRSVWPTYELSQRERIQSMIGTEEFVAVIAAIVYYLLGMPTILGFAAAIASFIFWAYVDFLRRDRLYDRQAEADLVKAIFPRMLYIAVSLLLPWLRWIFRGIGFILRIKPEDLLRNKTWSAFLITSLLVLYVDSKSGFSCWKFLKAKIWSAIGVFVKAINISLKGFSAGRGWVQQTKAVEVIWRMLTLLFDWLCSKFTIKRDSYEYHVLGKGHIRLLRIQKRIPFLSLRAQLVHVKLEDQPTYEAISYTWGTSTTKTDIVIDGQKFTTSTATYNALYGRSSLWRRRLVWIDAVCINQQDPIEKADQVAMMTDIYKSAAMVIVWLSRPSNLGFATAYLGIALLHELASVPKHINIYRKYETHVLTARWLALVELFCNQWFTRVWIIQEIAVASDVLFIYGGLSFKLDALSSGVEVFRDAEMSGLLTTTQVGRLAMQNINHFSSIARLRTRYQVHIPMKKALESSRIYLPLFKALGSSDKPHKLEETLKTLDMGLLRLTLPFLLTDFSSFSATRRRDKIFAFTGLAEDDLHPAFAPDYREETSVEDIYTNVARYILESKEPFAVISSAGIGSNRNLLHLPSWVPDWTSTTQGAPLTHPGYMDELDDTRFAASRKTLPHISFGPRPNDLNVAGFLIDEISSLGPISKIDYDDADFVTDAISNIYDPVYWEEAEQWHRETSQLALRGAKKYGDRNSTYEAFWRTLIGDQTPTVRPAPAALYEDYLLWVSHTQENAKMLEEFKTGKRDRLPSDDNYWARKQATATWTLAMGMCISGRRLAIARTGYMAVVPPKSEVGDVVAIVLGARTPLLLRKVNEPRDRDGNVTQPYMLVGECYVHGMMSGEMMDGSHDIETLLIN